MNPDEYDAAFVEQLLVPHSSGVRLLSSPIRVQDADLVTPQHVAGVLAIAQTHYDTIVADLAHDFRDTTLAVLDRASMILMPFAPELASIRSVAAALEVFRALEYPPEQIRLILNSIFPKSPLPQGEIEKALKHKIDLVILCDRDDRLRSVNRGESVTASAASSALGVLLEDHAFNLSRPSESIAAPDEPSEAWRRAAGWVGKSGGI